MTYRALNAMYNGDWDEFNKVAQEYAAKKSERGVKDGFLAFKHSISAHNPWVERLGKLPSEDERQQILSRMDDTQRKEVEKAENTFREFVTVNRSTTSEGKTLVGNRGNFLAYSHIGHDCVVGDDVVFSNNGTLAGHVRDEDLRGRVEAIALTYQGTPDSAVAAELFEADRALTTAGRVIDRALTALSELAASQ